MPTVEELLALPYTGSSAFANGLTGEDFRAQLATHGQPFRWWKAQRVSNNSSSRPRESNERIYTEQTPPEGSNVRALFYRTNREWAIDKDFIFPKGSTAISVMPDECELVAGDIIQPKTFRWTARERVTRATAGDDQLRNRTVVGIKYVMVGGLVKPANTYELKTGGAIRWLSSAPGAGVEYLVEYLYRPLFEFMGGEQAVIQIGEDGVFLPQRGIIQHVKASGTETTY